jgi:hypothetical protein
MTVRTRGKQGKVKVYLNISLDEKLIDCIDEQTRMIQKRENPRYFGRGDYIARVFAEAGVYPKPKKAVEQVAQEAKA